MLLFKSEELLCLIEFLGYYYGDIPIVGSVADPDPPGSAFFESEDPHSECVSGSWGIK